MDRQLDANWAAWLRRPRCLWMFLTAGIALGSWWAYYELGWGSWWFPDVENLALMPWLLGTALIHNLQVTAKQGQLPAGLWPGAADVPDGDPGHLYRALAC